VVRGASVKDSKKMLTTGMSRVNPQEVWVHDFTQRAEITQKRLEALEQALDNLLKINTQLPPVPPTLVDEPAIASLKQELKLAANGGAMNAQGLPDPPLGMTGATNIRGVFKSTELKKISLNLPKTREGRPLKTTDNTIPAGAFAQAMLLGGVDASTAIQASSDPRPILLRLVHPGTLPRRFSSDLKDCHALAACYGDISSERVFMRLEKLSCVERKTGEVMEINIQGYVAGEDGRAGIRGVLVDRAGPVMRNAMIGGFFSSMGKFLGQARTPLLFSPSTGLAQNNPVSGADLFKQSAAQGASGALDKYADFYIKRAEQMQPVIQVAAGRTVDIVFTQGFDFADSALRQALSKTRDQQRFSQIQKVEEQKPLEHWLSTEGNP
jgi:conjugal transfer pilus assembly protein TraB